MVEPGDAAPLLVISVSPFRVSLPPLTPTMTTSPPAWARAFLSARLRRSALTTAMVAPFLLASTALETLSALLTEIPSWRSSSATAIVPNFSGLSMASGVFEVTGLVHRVTRTGMSMMARAMTTGRHRLHR